MLPKEKLAISELSEVLYDFLPGKPHPFANKDISFPGVANRLTLGKYWTNGSKMKSISIFLSNVFDYERSKFCALILGIVNTSMDYKPKELYKRKIDSINKLLLQLSFKIPELNDREFLKSLPTDIQSEEKNIKKENVIDDELRKRLASTLMELTSMNDAPQQRGFAFEKFLTELFCGFDLRPREAFRVIGEQIDGSIELDNEIYLIEAKWQNTPISSNELYVFSGKIDRKAKWTRGLFISYSGFSVDAVKAFEKGKSVDFITIDGADLHFILEGHENRYINLAFCLREKMRHAAETGELLMPVLNIIKSN